MGEICSIHLAISVCCQGQGGKSQSLEVRRSEICVQAGMVSAAYLQANDEPNYQKWKAIEKTDCKTAGLSQ